MTPFLRGLCKHQGHTELKSLRPRHCGVSSPTSVAVTVSPYPSGGLELPVVIIVVRRLKASGLCFLEVRVSGLGFLVQRIKSFRVER